MGVNRRYFLGEIPPDCLCPVCHDVLENPQETPCQHAFCHNCISTWLKQKGTCPTCRSAVTWTDMHELHRIWRKKLNTLRMKCINCETGCDVIMEYQNIHLHLKRCEFLMLHCPHSMCDRLLPRTQIRDHILACEHRLVDCDKGCGSIVCYQERGQHKCIQTLRKDLQELRECFEEFKQETRHNFSQERAERIKLETFVHEQARAMEELIGVCRGLAEERRRGNNGVMSLLPVQYERKSSTIPRLPPLIPRVSLVTPQGNASREMSRRGRESVSSSDRHRGPQR